MTVSKGEIWLANLNPVKRNNEVGKVRPVLILQNDTLNRSSYPTTIVIPLTTQCIDGAEPIRMRIGKRERLMQDSDIVMTQIRAIDNSRFIEPLASVTAQELKQIKQYLLEVIE